MPPRHFVTGRALVRGARHTCAAGRSKTLHEAAAKGDVTRMARLLGEGHDINGKAVLFGHTPLHRGSAMAQEQAVSFLLSRGARVNERNELGSTALHLASASLKVERRGPAVVELLVKAGADISACDNSQLTPLMRAAWEGRTGMIGLLITCHAADVGFCTAEGNDALQKIVKVYSLSTATTACMRELLNFGGSISPTHGSGLTDAWW